MSTSATNSEDQGWFRYYVQYALQAAAAKRVTLPRGDVRPLPRVEFINAVHDVVRDDSRVNALALAHDGTYSITFKDHRPMDASGFVSGLLDDLENIRCQVPVLKPTATTTPTATTGGTDAELSSRSKPRRPLIITCRQCGTQGPEGNARAVFAIFPNDSPELTLCTNRLGSRQAIRGVMAHELTHA